MNADLSIYLYFVLFFILLVLFIASKIEKKRRNVSSVPGKNSLSESESAASAEEGKTENR